MVRTASPSSSHPLSPPLKRARHTAHVLCACPVHSVCVEFFSLLSPYFHEMHASVAKRGKGRSHVRAHAWSRPLTHMHMHMHARTRTHTHTHTQTHTHTLTRSHTHTQTHTHTHTLSHTHSNTHTHSHALTHTLKHTHTHTHTLSHTHTHTHTTHTHLPRAAHALAMPRPPTCKHSQCRRVQAQAAHPPERALRDV